MSTRVTTPEFTASFPQLFEASGFAGSEPKYSITMMWDKNEDLSKLRAACDAAIEKKFGKDVPKDIQMPVQDGDGKLDKDGKQRPEYAGMKFAIAKAKVSDQPKVVDTELNPILDATLVYGGCKMRAAVSAYAWSFASKHGVSLYLGNVQRVSDGEQFGNTNSVESDFGGF
ncbi:DUF2815 family protein [bacterium]|nr:DUF2815 family protein [bacterium]